MKLLVLSSKKNHLMVDFYDNYDVSIHNLTQADFVAVICRYNVVKILKNRYGDIGSLPKESFDLMVRDEAFIEIANVKPPQNCFGFNNLNYYQNLPKAKKEFDSKKEEFLQQYIFQFGLLEKYSMFGSVVQDGIEAWKQIQEACK